MTTEARLFLAALALLLGFLVAITVVDLVAGAPQHTCPQGSSLAGPEVCP